MRRRRLVRLAVLGEEVALGDEDQHALGRLHVPLQQADVLQIMVVFIERV